MCIWKQNVRQTAKLISYRSEIGRMRDFFYARTDSFCNIHLTWHISAPRLLFRNVWCPWPGSELGVDDRLQTEADFRIYWNRRSVTNSVLRAVTKPTSSTNIDNRFRNFHAHLRLISNANWNLSPNIGTTTTIHANPFLPWWDFQCDTPSPIAVRDSRSAYRCEQLNLVLKM